MIYMDMVMGEFLNIKRMHDGIGLQYCLLAIKITPRAGRSSIQSLRRSAFAARTSSDDPALHSRAEARVSQAQCSNCQPWLAEPLCIQKAYVRWHCSLTAGDI